MTIPGRAIAVAVMAISATMIPARAQQPVNDAEAITPFLRAVDAYAFQHRQVERRAGDAPDQSAMAAAMRSSRQAAGEGAMFSPPVANAFRARIAAALRSTSCRQPSSASAVVPRPNDDASGAAPLASCVAATLPRLPEELDYRIAGVALLLVDVHANLVVDVLHAAVPQ